MLLPTIGTADYVFDPLSEPEMTFCLKAWLPNEKAGVYGVARLTLTKFRTFDAPNSDAFARTVGYFQVHGAASCCHPGNTKPPFPVSGSGVWYKNTAELNLHYIGTTWLDGAQGNMVKFMAAKWLLPLPAEVGTKAVWDELGFYIPNGRDLPPNAGTPVTAALDYRFHGEVIPCNEAKF